MPKEYWMAVARQYRRYNSVYIHHSHLQSWLIVAVTNNGDYDVTTRINEDDTIQSIMRHAIRYFWTLFGPLPYFTYSYNRNHVVYACR